MHNGMVPPAAIGLAAGLLTSTVAVAISATRLLPVWITTPLLFLAGGLAAGLVAPVRPTMGALLGAVTGIFAGVFLTVVLSVQWRNPDPEMFFTPFPFALIAVASVIMSTPVYAVAGAVGAAVRPLLMPLPSSAERGRRLTPDRRQLAGIAAGALAVLAGVEAWRLTGWIDPAPVLLIFSIIGGATAGFLSTGGARAGAGAALLAGVFSLGAQAIFFIVRASTSPATGDGVPEGLWPIALAIMAFWVLPAVALGGRFRKPAGPSPEPEL